MHPSISGVLQCLHVFWFGLILLVASKKFGGGRLEDSREDTAQGVKVSTQAEKKGKKTL